MARGRVVVVGSLNVDLVVAAGQLPRPGETVIGGTFSRHLGGKGANQAVAAARAGASVVFVGMAGRDADGDASIAALTAEGIDVSRVERSDAPTGVAVVAVGPDGENQIVVASGANAHLSDKAASLPDLPVGPGVVLACLEVPIASVAAACRAAARLGMRAIVNPAPAQQLPPELSAGVILTPNKEELRVMTGADDIEPGVAALIAAGATAVVLTLGANGAFLTDGLRRRAFPPLAVDVVDATGAGDTFSGTLAAWLASGHDLDAAVEAANCSAGLSVRSAGARDGMPNRAAIEAALQG